MQNTHESMKSVLPVWCNNFTKCVNCENNATKHSQKKERKRKMYIPDKKICLSRVIHLAHIIFGQCMYLLNSIFF
jgi:hypothetical protein